MSKRRRILLGGVFAAALVAGEQWWVRTQIAPTAAERQLALPGDGLIADAEVTITHAITIEATPEEVWPWIAQLGQERGGFYSYSAMENLVGCQIVNADRIVPEWQDVKPGDPFHLAPQVALAVADVQPGKALVISSEGGEVPGSSPYAFSWAFVLEPHARGTRLIVRERYGCPSTASRAEVAGITPISAVMTVGMLRGIRKRSQAPGVG